MYVAANIDTIDEQNQEKEKLVQEREAKKSRAKTKLKAVVRLGGISKSNHLSENKEQS